jgi:hypothetical protein
MTTGVYPEANIIVNSGHGVHVYYLFAKPIEMYTTRLESLNKLKAGLTKIIWLVSRLGVRRAQIQSVVQGFRLPGTKTKFGRTIRAFWNKSAPLYTPAELNNFLGQDKLSIEDIMILNQRNPYNPGRVTLAEAQKMWPEWYASRVIGHKRVGKKWKIKRALYDWWLSKLVHHRYWCILTLVIYAVKCGVPRDEAMADALALVPLFDRKSETQDNPFLEDDVIDAFKAYDEEYNKWPISVIESTTGIRIRRNKRNGRSQETHLEIARAIRDIQCRIKGKNKWSDGCGRKQGSTIDADNSRCAAIVKDWRKNNPSITNKARCARETGLARPTVYKWWNISID